jgi:hypothetical protein
MESPWLRNDDAADYCGYKGPTFEKMRVAGTGPVYHKRGRIVLYRVGDLDEWLAQGRRRSTSDLPAGAVPAYPVRPEPPSHKRQKRYSAERAVQRKRRKRVVGVVTAAELPAPPE